MNSILPPQVFLPTHRIVFTPIGMAPEVTPVMITRSEIWTLAEWNARDHGQGWSNDHEWILMDGELWWTHGAKGLSYTPGNRSGEIKITEAT